MSYQFNIASEQKLSHKVTLEELDSVRAVLLKASYELLEIKHIEEQHVSEIWQKVETKEKLYLEIIPDEELDNSEPEATLQTVVDELVDLWVELRAIRNAVEDYEDDHAYKTVRELSAFEKYNSKVEEFEEEWKDDDNHLKKIFKDDIDPSVLAFLDLDEDDKLLLTN